jgi:hypothetical protein
MPLSKAPPSLLFQKRWDIIEIYQDSYYPFLEARAQHIVYTFAAHLSPHTIHEEAKRIVAHNADNGGIEQKGIDQAKCKVVCTGVISGKGVWLQVTVRQRQRSVCIM